MKIAIHDAEREHLKNKTFPNYALMKISAYHKAQGDTVEWWNPLEMYDKVYSSKVFDFTLENPMLPPDTIKGGTGYDIKSKLPPEIEQCMPDYSIYPECDHAIGFVTRGCPNHCRWCVVPEKEGNIKSYEDCRILLGAFHKGRPLSESKKLGYKLVLMDNNILACDYGIEQLKLIASIHEIKLDINQGMDARLITPEIADILARINWIKYIRFSCDTKSQIEPVIRAAELLKARGIKPYKLFIYLLVSSDVMDAAIRVTALKHIGSITIYAQPERNERLGIVPNQEQKYFAGRYVYRGIYRKETWSDYKARHTEIWKEL
ncbi:radical SAM protein [Clostridia bacterium]|nr:radical SAM protein [Clostridia bacterium]